MQFPVTPFRIAASLAGRRLHVHGEAVPASRLRPFDRCVFNFIPRGGDDFDTGHRCLSEWVTIELMKGVVRQLTAAMGYDLPLRDLSIDLSRMLAIPKSRFVIANVRRAEHEADGGGKPS